MTKTETLNIYLKSGAILQLKVTDWSITKNKDSALGMTNLSWTMADKNQLPFLNLDQVDAVFVEA